MDGLLLVVAGLALAGYLPLLVALRRCRRATRAETDSQRAELERQRSELAAINKLLRLSNRRLAQSNQDLEAFAYAASHDLQTPLRKVANFSVHLRDEFGERLDDPMAQKYLNFITASAAKAQELINGLLQFSRTGREIDTRCFNLRDALDDALFILDEDIREKGAQISSDTLPKVYADKTLLARVFQNLVGNAIKFRHPDRVPQIRIKVVEETHEWHIQVEDNGVGFDPRFADRIFVIFQRLELRKNGSGLGLALCKRIIERHNGRIWAESIPGEGSTFHFTLPKERCRCPT